MMRDLTVSGDFVTGFQLFLSYLPDADASFPYSHRLAFTDSLSDPLAIFSAGFNGDFVNRRGTIDTIEGSISYLVPGLEEWDFEFSNVNVSLSAIFTIAGNSISYKLSSITSLLSGRAYSVSGSRGDDIIGGSRYFEFSRGDTIRADSGDDVVYSGAGADTVYAGSGDDRLVGARGADKLFGQDGTDLLLGGGGADRLGGGDGNDTLSGGIGDDLLIGGRGDDVLAGGTGFDRMTGGAGNDVFAFGPDKTTDRVTDFVLGADRIQTLSATGFDELDILDRKAGCFVHDGKVSLFLVGVDGADLSADDFIF